MRVAIFGGTFDPIHKAHLTVAEEALAAFCLREVLVIPAGNPPHKDDAVLTPFAHRYRMVELACQGVAGLKPSKIEENSDHSFSVLTIERLKAQRPEDEFFFLIGADAFSEITTWYRWRDVIRMVEFLVAARPGHRYQAPEGARVHRLSTVALAVSSSSIREKLEAGLTPEEVPAAVLEYIRQNGLYGGGKASGIMAPE